jgi:ankyrin repeat protein
VAQSGAGATSTRSALRAAKAIPTPLASLAPQQRLDNAEQATQSTEKESPRVMDLTPALQASARAGQVAQVEHLLRQGALINAPDEAGRTPLILATINGHTRLVARLLALGANPALTDHDDLTALQHARRLRHWQIADLLGG